MPGKMSYLGYTADGGTIYSLKTRSRYLGALDKTVAGTAMLGFLAYDATKPAMPRGWRPRGVYLEDPSGGATRFVPCGTATCPAYDRTSGKDTVQIDYSGIGTLTDANIIGVRAERRRGTVHAIINRSDAS